MPVVWEERLAEANDTVTMCWAKNWSELQDLHVGEVSPAENHDRAAWPEHILCHQVAQTVFLAVNGVKVEDQARHEVKDEWNEPLDDQRASNLGPVGVEQWLHELTGKPTFLVEFFEQLYAVAKPLVVLEQPA